MANIIRLGGGGEYFSKLKIVVPEGVDSVQCYQLHDDGSTTEMFDGDKMEAGMRLYTVTSTEGVYGQYYELTNDFPYFEVTVGEKEEVGLEDFSWEMIVTLAQAGMMESLFNIGDTKTLTLSDGWSTVATIIGFNHDEKYDESGYCNVTFDFAYVYPTTSTMFDSSASSGYYRWYNCNVRNTLLPSIFNDLPQTLQDNIAEVKKNTIYTFSTVMNSYTDNHDTADKLFILSCTELGLTVGLSGENSSVYQFYSDGGSKIKTHSDQTTAVMYWVRNPVYGYSASSTSTKNWYYVGTSGAGNTTPVTSTCYTSVAFCL